MYKRLQASLSEKRLQRVAWFLVSAGIIYRIILWWQNRGLFIDEANLARNIYERSFIGLLKPLSHEQFAPPVFLWITKLNTCLFGFDEKVLRLFPLLSGIFSLILFYKIAKQFISYKSLWYPLVLFATGALYLRYSTEFKQYMPDSMVSLILIYLAMKVDAARLPVLKFCLIWILLGTIAIWTSMPSVFILTAVGVYYFVQLMLSDKKSRITALLFIGLIWLVQFAVYFFLILKNQMNSSYLQACHSWYFLDAFPKSIDQFSSHNWQVIRGLAEVTGGKLGVSITLNLLFTLLGYIYIFKTKNYKGILLIVPGILVLTASLMKSYSLAERLMLFCIPCWLLIIGIGFEYLLKSKFHLLKFLCVGFAIFTAIKFNKISYITTRPLRLESVNKCLDYLVANKITAKDLYIDNLASGGYTYYTEIHPQKNKWKSLKHANQLPAGTDFEQVFKHVNTKSSYLSTSLGQGVYVIWKDIEMTNKVESTFDETDAKVIIFSPE